jgi:4-amino-4-deoxy-L-arabinose transferase-like glycosyltransferase
VAPVPFLLTEKLMTQIFGMGEVALRFLPFVCGVALLPLSWRIARRTLSPRFALFALAMIVVSPALVRESNNVKQYAWDAALATLVLLLALRVVQEPKVTRVRSMICVGLIACLSSLTGIFVVGPAFAALVLYHWERGHRTRVRSFAWALITALTLTVLPYALLYRSVATSDYMRGFWQGSFVSPAPFTAASNNALIAADAVWGFLAGNLPLARGNLALTIAMHAVTVTVVAFAVTGAVTLLRKDSSAALIVAAPLVLLVGASLGGFYPMRSRLEVFLIVPFAVLVVAGAERLSGRFGRWVLPVSAMPLLTLGLGGVTVRSMWPYQWEELRPVVQALEARPITEPVYVYANAGPAWLYYTTNWTNPDTGRLSRVMEMIRVGGPAFENAFQLAPAQKLAPVASRWNARAEHYGRSTGVPWRPYIDVTSRPMRQEWISHERAVIESLARPKVWLVFAHYRGTENPLLDDLERDGLQQQNSIWAKGAVAFLYQARSEIAR